MGLNNRAEILHQPTRRRERQMKRFKSAIQAQRFLAAHDGISNLFQLRRHQVPAPRYRAARTQAFLVCAEVQASPPPCNHGHAAPIARDRNLGPIS